MLDYLHTLEKQEEEPMKLLKKAFLGFLFILISAGVFLTLVLVLDLDSASKQQAFDP